MQPRVWLKRSASTAAADDARLTASKRARVDEEAGADDSASSSTDVDTSAAAAAADAVACVLPVQPADVLHAWRSLSSLGELVEPAASALLTADIHLASSVQSGAVGAVLPPRPLHLLLAGTPQEDKQ